MVFETAPFEEVQMMSDRAIVEDEIRPELIRVARPLPERLDDPRTVRASAGAREEEPEELTKRRAHRDPDA